MADLFFSKSKLSVVVPFIVFTPGHKNIPKNSKNKPRGVYFSKALFEGLIFGGAYIRREIAFQNRLG